MIGNNLGAANVFWRFSIAAIRVTGTGSSNNTIAGNIIGLQGNGAVFPSGEQSALGVLVQGLATGNTIGGTTESDRNIISNHSGPGVMLLSAGNVVQGNRIGTDLSGLLARGNGGSGIEVQAANNTIGGTLAGAGNLIAGNVGAGIRFTGSTANGGTVQGNLIGLDVNGESALENAQGIVLQDGAQNIVIGGTVAGAGNVISGNDTDGIRLQNLAGNVTGVVIQGNLIGTRSDGVNASPNGDHGIALNDVTGNTIGGTAAGARNVVAGNDLAGIILSGLSTSNSVLGNRVGTNAAGTAALPNQDGIFVAADGNTIGGSAAGAGNLVSGNSRFGIIGTIEGEGNLIQGNTVGLDVTGEADLGNGNGIFIEGNGNTIGGTAAGAGNVAAGNDGNQLHLSGSDNNLVQGNRFGTNAAGTVAIPGGFSTTGVSNNGANNTIGGTTAAARNVIAIGLTDGDGISLSGAVNTQILGNYIGTDVSGTLDLAALSSSGVAVTDGPGTVIGDGTAGGANLIAGCGDGILLDTFNVSSAVVIRGNVIGLDATGTAALPNESGIAIAGAGGHTIGGTAAGAGNVISGNTVTGLRLESGADGNLIQGNLLGLNAAGTVSLPNINGGILVESADNTIGGTTSGARNVFAIGPGGFGVVVGAGTSGAVIAGNYFGTDATGEVDLAGSSSTGIVVAGGIGHVIGGAEPGAGNLVSGCVVGISLVSGDAIVVNGNVVGLNAAGTAALPNLIGVSCESGAPSAVIGTPAAGNVIAGNTSHGLRLVGATGYTVQGNRIGTDAAGTTAFGNGGNGLLCSGGGAHAIGGVGAGEGNLIAHNGLAGIALNGGVTPSGIRGNRTFNNGGLGIDLGTTGVTINDAGDTDSGDNDLLNFPILIGASSNGSSLVVTGFVGPNQTVDLYRADPDPSGFGEGAEYVGTFTEGGAADTDPGTGTYNVPINGLNQGTDTTNRFLATLTPAIALNPGDLLTAVATDTIASSSEFSGNVTVAGPPAQLAFLVQPSDSVVNTVITPAVQVEIQDASGARVASDATVTLTTPTDPTPGVLNGTTSVAAVGGVATFADLSLSRVRSSYVLRADSAGVVSANSNAFAVTPGPAAGALSTANVPNGTVGAPTVITVQARDSAGNARTEGGDVVVVTISGANNATATVVDNTDGTYTATYTPTASGVDQVAISLGGTALTGSPFPSTVAGGATVPGQSTANVPNGTVGTPTVITVQARDSEGNARTVGGDEVVVTVSGSNTASPTVTDNGNGTYTAQYTPASPGTDQVAIALNGGAVSGSPFTSLVMANASSGAQSTATVPDGTAGALTTIIIQARDADGNARTVGGDTVVVMISGANSINPTVIDQGNGTYTAQYIPATAGIDEVAISLNGTSLTGSPFGSLVTTGSVSASDSSVVPNPASVVADGTTPISLLITVRDPLGNPIAGVPADAVQVFTSGVAVSITQPSAPTNAAGQTTAELRSTTPGAALATVSVGQLALDAVTATFTPRVVSGSQSSVDLSPPAIAADDTQLATLTVTLRDAAGNPVIGSPPSDRTIAIAGTATGGAGLVVADSGEASDDSGQFTVTFRASVADTYRIAVAVAGVALPAVQLQALAPFAAELPAGVRFLALPLTLSDPTPEALFGPAGWRLARWNTATDEYDFRSPGDPPNEALTFAPGRGLFVRLDDPTSLNALGTITPDAPFDLALPNGWSMAGNPYNADLRWDLAAIRVMVNGVDRGPLSEPSLWDTIRPYVWIYDPASDSYRLVFSGVPGVATTVPRLQGFWARALVDGASLRLAAPARSRATPPVPTARDWAVRLSASVAGGAGGEVLLGQNTQLSRSLVIDAPPEEQGPAGVRLTVVEGGERTAGSLTPAGTASWELAAVSRAAGEVTLAWPSLLRQIPAGLILELTDLQTGQRLLLNTRSAYRYLAQAAGEERRLRLTARFGRLDRATITTMSSQPTRGGGLSVSLTISAPAEVRLTVKGLGGRLVKQVSSGAQAAGPLTITWDGTDATGRRVPAGTYVLEALAVAANGAESRASRTVVVR